MTRPSRSLPGFLLAAMLAAPASAQDLTGTWRAENGTRYVVLQSGEEFCWYAEPTSLFCGRVLGSLIVGSWLDLPTSFSRSGRMILRIESPNRLIKVHETANYPVSVWVREGTVPGPVAQAPPPPPPPPQLPPPTPTVTPAAGPAPIPGGSPGAAGGDVMDGGTLNWDGVVPPELRDRPGRRIRYTCPPGGQFYGYVWGTDVYEGGSLPCAAAVHAGLITFAAGGTITVEIRPGQASFRGSDRNGVASKGWDGHSTSYSLASGAVSALADRGAPPPPAGGAAGGDVMDGGTLNWDMPVAPELRTRPGRRIRYTCPPGGQFYGYVWGTDVYEGASLPCAAAVHAGLITYAAGGTITVEIRPGQASFRGSDRNGVASKNWDGYSTSYSFASGAVSAMADRGAPPPAAGGAAGGDVMDGGTLNWDGVVPPESRGKIGTRIRYSCPPGGQFYGYVWGTGVYTGDTLPCAAAVHAGVITFAAGGTITVEIRPGQTSYQGSDRNGVASKNFGPYTSSYVIVR